MRKFWIGVLVLIHVNLAYGGQYTLNFKDSKFKILQLSDLHWTENSSAGCKETGNTIRSIIRAEKPGVIILTGDIVTEQPAVKGWKSVITILESERIPFAAVMGNHDGEYLSKDSIYALLSGSPFFIGEKGPGNISGCGNYVLPVYDSKGKHKISALLYCLDSNAYAPETIYGLYDWIHFDQITWYRNKSRSYARLNGNHPLPALAFFHIPLPEYADLIGRPATWGQCLEHGTGAPKLNSGMFTSFVDSKDVMGVFTGHDHDNDFIGQKMGIALSYCRVTGTDAYGSLKRGGRVIELYENKRKFDSWIVTPSGRECSYYYPSGITSLEEESSVYFPAVQVSPKHSGVSYSYYEGNFKKVADMFTHKVISKGVMKNFSIKLAPKGDHFGYDFHTLLKISEKGIYNFSVYSDDGAKLYLDGELVVDNDSSHSATWKKGRIALDKGFHEMRVSYFEDYMGQDLQIHVSGHNLEEMALPDSWLFLSEK